MNRKLKKYNLRYEYLKLEEEDIRAELSSYIDSFDDMFRKYYEMPKPGVKQREVWVNDETGEVRDEPPPFDDFEKAKKEHEEAERKRIEEAKELKNKPRKLKRLYKKLATKVHPDRGGSDSLFQEVNDAYTNDNLMWLLRKAGEFDIEYEVDDSDEDILEKNLSEIEKEIHRMRDTLAWVWGTGDVNMRKHVIKRVELETGQTISTDDLPDDLRPPEKEEQKKLDTNE